MSIITVQGRRLEYHIIGDADAALPTLVFLHEGLGSVAMWKDFPARCAQETGCRALVYSRYGYGESDELQEPRRPDYLLHEAIEALPELLSKLEIENPVLIGHSDGATIALLNAAASIRPPKGIIAMAPHTSVEEKAIRGIESVKQMYEATDLCGKLGRYHLHPDSVFRGWSDIWLSPEFRGWNIEEYLPRITCPVLAIQGEDDQYATTIQLDSIARAVPHAQILMLKHCRHSPHIDHPETVIEHIAGFVASLLNQPTTRYS